MFTIVAIHEWGHFAAARSNGWRVSHIEFWLFGGAVVSDEHSTKPFKEQAHVILSGPIQHVWIAILLFLLQYFMGPHPLLSTALHYNGLVLLLNLLPIWPLDGGKLLFYVLTQLISFQKSLKVTLFLSLACILTALIVLLLEQRMTLSGLLLAGFLLLENGLEWKRRTFTFMRYLIYGARRDPGKLKVKYLSIDPNTPVRNVLKNVRANRRHFYILKRKPGLYIVDEQECLRMFIDQKKTSLRMEDLPQIL
ncbi:site-2 protease family protein [Halobacillus shinanisalinarum]|uniref:Site-2 protease family protein n=1 Tax=Halobacillus shinanisalinarum TaxID=2932258 RepID=A0ABY4H097_9BACI|nr:site-2 protease family protein [Halobacillus shinanisalinarum]UOQ93866.1 site-2 protease family protein [Halobacillus shinanisalinarum]